MPDNNNGHGNGLLRPRHPAGRADRPRRGPGRRRADQRARRGFRRTERRAVYHADDQVVALLSQPGAPTSWPSRSPSSIDLETAVAAVRAGMPAAKPTRSARARHLVPVAAAAAFLVLVGGGVTIGSATAEPDSALWPVSKVLFSERAESVEAAVRVSDKIDNAKQALSEGKPEQARRGSRAGPARAVQGAPAGGQGRARRREGLPRREGGRDAVGREGQPGVAAEGRHVAVRSPRAPPCRSSPPRRAPSPRIRPVARPRAVRPRRAPSAPASRLRRVPRSRRSPRCPRRPSSRARRAAVPPRCRSRPHPRAIRTPPRRPPTTGWAPAAPRPAVGRARKRPRPRRARRGLSGVGEHRVGVAAAVLPRDVVRRVGVERGLVRAHLALVEQLLQARPQQAPLVVVLLAAIARSRPRCRARRASPTTPGTPRDRRDRPPPRRAPRCSTPRARRAPGRRWRARGRADPRRTGPAAAHRVTQRQRYPASGSASSAAARPAAASRGYDEVVFGGVRPRCWERCR